MVCESFGCMPNDAIEAIENDVGGLIFKIIELRAYASAKQQYDSAPSADKRPTGGIYDRVSETVFALKRKEIAKRKADV